MCGIVGYIGKKEPAPLLIEGLRRLEYRGYDSAGVAIFDNGEVKIERTVGKLRQLEASLKGRRFSGPIGVGHTRWATHGRTSLENAHPHHFGRVTVVHNGIIENYAALRDSLISKGHKFDSQTDTEIICHLMDEELNCGCSSLEAIQRTVTNLTGAFALGIIFDEDQSSLYAVRNGAPLLVGIGDGENFIASDAPAILNFTRDVIYLNDEEIAICTVGSCSLFNFKNEKITRSPERIDWSAEMVEKGGFPHYMLKEIHEQPRALKETIEQYVDKTKMLPIFPDTELSREEINNIERVEIIACGTSYYAGLVAQYYFEEFTRLPTTVSLASEYRYRNPVADNRTLVVCITQSGETADTLCALRMAKKLGAMTVGLTNVCGSTITREARGTFYTHAGLEIGVASTKAFTTQIATLLLFSLYVAQVKNLPGLQIGNYIKDILEVPGLVERALNREHLFQNLATKYSKYQNFFFIGRHLLYPIALEGALKLKELSYISAEGYAAGEMKHGPIALVDQELPVVCLAPFGPTHDKILSNIAEICARDGIIVGIGDSGDERLKEHSAEFIHMPTVPYILSPIVYTIPVQLLAYYIASERGTDIDQPKNLAKSVTVE